MPTFRITGHTGSPKDIEADNEWDARQIYMKEVWGRPDNHVPEAFGHHPRWPGYKGLGLFVTPLKA